MERAGIASRISVLATALCAAAAAVHAQPSGADGLRGLYLQGGHNIVNGDDTKTLFLGLTVPRDRGLPESPVTAYWDLFYARWQGPQANGIDRGYHQIGAIAMWRYRLDERRSPWFFDYGIGLSYLDGTYSKPTSRPGGRTFGSRLNFTGRLGLGRSFGAQGRHEVSLNYQHFSNAGLKRPNPGEDFVQLRYAYKF